MARLPPVDPETYSEAQRAAHAEIARLRNNAVSGPFSVWIRHPDVASAANRFGDAVKSAPELAERHYRLAALVVARQWHADYAWRVHADRAVDAGLDAGAVERLRLGEAPGFPDATDHAAFMFLSELLETRRVSDATYARAESAIGPAALVALVAAAGFFSMAGLTLSAFEIG